MGKTIHQRLCPFHPKTCHFLFHARDYVFIYSFDVCGREDQLKTELGRVQVQEVKALYLYLQRCKLLFLMEKYGRVSELQIWSLCVKLTVFDLIKVLILRHASLFG